jgi:hypothetical protein
MTVSRAQEIELFEMLGRNPVLKDWVTGKLDLEMKILMQNADAVQLHRAQGRSLMLQQLLDLMVRK